MHLISARQFKSQHQMECLFRTATWLKEGKESTSWHRSSLTTKGRSALSYNKSPLAGKVMATLFYQPSTRTRSSFESAMIRLGGGVVSTENAAEFSSAIKGETLEDTIRVMNEYADVIVLRHPDEDSAERAASCSSVPIINAGSGANEHPTQALLDMYSIAKEMGRLHGLKIALVGDLLNGRTIHSLIYLLCLCKDIHLVFVSPRDLRLPEEVERHVIHNSDNLIIEEVGSVAEALETEPDVVYMTRAQNMSYNYDDNFVFAEKDLAKLKKDAIILHPLPRRNEIDRNVDKDRRLACFRQVGYGLLVRLAILRELFWFKDKVAWNL